MTFGFDTLFDRAGTGRSATKMDFFDVVGFGQSGDTGTAVVKGCAVVPQMVEAVSGATVPSRPAIASAFLPEAGSYEYRAITFGPAGAIAVGTGRIRPIWEAVAGCYGCGAELRVAAVGYLDMVRLIEAAGGHHIARPVEQVWCPACRGDRIEAGGPGLVGAGAGIVPDGPAAHDAGGSARPGPAPITWGRSGSSARGTEVAKCV